MAATFCKESGSYTLSQNLEDFALHAVGADDAALLSSGFITKKEWQEKIRAFGSDHRAGYASARCCSMFLRFLADLFICGYSKDWKPHVRMLLREAVGILNKKGKGNQEQMGLLGEWLKELMK
jgi:hypothetical protein